MINKKFLIGMLAVALVFGMTVVGCEEENEEEQKATEIEIREIEGKTGQISVLLYSYLDANANGVVAGGQGTISNKSVTVSMQKQGGDKWIGEGNHHVLLQFSDNTVYAYTNGLSLASLGIETENDFYTKLPKIDIMGVWNSISFNKFLDVTDF